MIADRFWGLAKVLRTVKMTTTTTWLLWLVYRIVVIDCSLVDVSSVLPELYIRRSIQTEIVLRI